MAFTNEGIVLLAKQSGITSFSALWQIKDALKTKKTGHTGTLDTFADGLLVALTGRYTRLVPYITDCDKEYTAYIAFGNETDTLDPEGRVIHTAPLPNKSAFLSILDRFRGEIDQTPPLFSAVHVEGKRASDRVRGGESIELQPRRIQIYTLEVLSLELQSSDSQDLVSAAILRVVCSKGTYIRSLARDIALAAGSRAHLAALRRTRIGPFSLDAAAGRGMLAPFSRELAYQFGKGERPPRIPVDEIRSGVSPFDREMAVIIGLAPISLKAEFRTSFSQGMKMDPSWFTESPGPHHAVFEGDTFLGTIRNTADTLSYGFVFGGPA